jgi:peptide/nickel transport system substrate-binding protein
MNGCNTIGSAFAAVCVAAAAAFPASAAAPRDTLVIAQSLGVFVTLDPAALNESSVAGMMRNVCDSLVSLDPADASKVVPGVARSWEMAADGTMTFHLREGLKFASGNPVTADDVVWSIRRTIMLNLANASRLREWGITAENVANAIRVVDPLTLEARMPRPFAPTLLPFAFTDFRVAPVIDRTIVMRNERDGDMGSKWLQTNSACYGPYRISSIRPQDRVILERYDGHWQDLSQAVRRVIIRHVPEPGAQRLLLEKGDIDVADAVDPADFAAIERNPDTRIVRADGLDIRYLALNQKDPILSHPKVREAFRYLIDYQALEKSVMRNIGRVRQTFTTSKAFGAIPVDETPFKLDLEKAKQLIAAAGYPNGFSKELLVRNEFPDTDIAQHIQENARKIGIRLEVRSMAYSQILNQVRGRNFELAYLGYGYNYPDANNMFLRMVYNPDNSDAARNTLSVAWRSSWDPGKEINDLGMAAQSERETDKRKAMYQKIQRDTMWDSPHIYTFENFGISAYHSSLIEMANNGVQSFYWTARKR